MSERELADIICRALIMIVVAIRKKYGLPDYRGITLIMAEEKPAEVKL